MTRSTVRRISRRWFLVATVAALVVSERRLAAEDADAIVSRGVELRRQGHDNEALAEFQRAMKIQKAPRIQAQVALAEQALGLWVAAEEDLVEALADKGDAWIKKNQTTLEKALATIQAHLGTLEVWGTPPGATIFVNEKPVGTLPLKKPVRVAGDSVMLRAHADGYLDAATHAVRVPAGETTREHVELVSAARAAGFDKSTREAQASPGPSVMTTETKLAAAEPLTGVRPPLSQDQPPEPAAPPASKLRVFAWAAGAAAVGGLVLGVVETFARRNNRDAFNNYAQPNPADPGHPIMNYCSTMELPAECKPLQQAYDRSVTLMIVGYAAGGALAIGSAVLFAMSSSPDGPSGSAVACLPDPTSRGLSCLLRF